VPLVPLVAQWNRMPALYTMLGFVAWLALIGSVVSLRMLRDDGVRALWFQVVVPGLVAGLTTAMFSSNNEIGFGVGALPAGQAIVGILAIAGGRYFESANAKNAMIVAATVTLCWLIPSAQQYLPGGVYRDDDVWRLDALIDHGPFAGLRTTSLKLAYLHQLESDLVAVESPRGRVMFFYNFPAGYLMTPMLPAPPSVWTLPGAAARRGDHLPYFFDERSRWPDVVVRMVRVPYMNKISALNDYSAGDRLNDAFRSYTMVIVRDDYQILQRSESRVFAKN
jgi:hypothetical protein